MHTRLISRNCEACGPSYRCKHVASKLTNLRTHSYSEKAKPSVPEAIDDKSAKEETDVHEDSAIDV